jgi:uncharacterized protein YlxP (DUF503 family)
MPVGLLTLELHIPDARSLKEKRQILRSLKDRLRRKFNIAIAELDFHDVWQSSTIGIVTLSNAQQHVEESLQHVLAESHRILGRVLVDHSVDFL